MTRSPRPSRLNYDQFTKVMIKVGGGIGLLLGVIYSFGGLLIDTLVTLDFLSAASWDTPGLSKGTILAFGALIGMPMIVGVLGCFFGLIATFVYNMAMRISEALSRVGD